MVSCLIAPANVGGRMGAKLLISALLNTCTRLGLTWADSGYDGAPLADWIHAATRITVEVIKRTEVHTFRVRPAPAGGPNHNQYATGRPAQRRTR